MKALLHFDAGPAVLALLDRYRSTELTIDWCPVADRGRLATALAATDVLLHVLDPVTELELGLAPRLRLVQKLGVGVNTIDLGAASARGVAVANMPGVNTAAAAEHTVALLLAVLRRLPVYHAATAAGAGWAVDAAVGDTTGEVAGRTVGLVGHGAIARRVERVLTAMDATVLHTSRTPDGPSWRSLDELVATCDVVSLHVPLTPETAGLLSAERIAHMKPGAVVLNTARGGVVDQAALTAALQSGHLRGAGLDVFADEPTRGDEALLSLPNVVLTPHVAWLTVETVDRCLAVAVENCRRLATGEELLHRVV